MNKRGSSTVFIMIIVAGLLALGLIFIDITRIVVAENRIKRAAKTAENSVLAGYNKPGAIDFGLFGEANSNETRQAIFCYYFRNNISDGQSRLGINYIFDTKDCQIEAMQDFMDDKVLKSQMIGSVKYKSPGVWLNSLADVFNGKELQNLKEKNQEARNSREKKSELKRRLAELKSQLKTVKDDGKAAILDEITNVSRLLEVIDGSWKGKSNSEAKISDADTAKDFFAGKLNELTGIKNRMVPEDYFPNSQLNTEDASLEGFKINANTDESREALDQSALSVIREFGDAIKESATGSADKLFLAEYLLDRFSSLLYEKEGHFYQKGEIEYIISGNAKSTELSAISITVMKIWTLRFAINFIVDISNSLIPEPMERLAYALMTAGIEASTDLVRLISGYKVEALPKHSKKIELSYEDHLRLLLYMKSEKDLLAGTRIMINASNISNGRPGVENMGTFFRVKYKASINLLFIPMLKPELLSEKFRGGKYTIEREEYFGY